MKMQYTPEPKVPPSGPSGVVNAASAGYDVLGFLPAHEVVAPIPATLYGIRTALAALGFDPHPDRELHHLHIAGVACEVAYTLDPPIDGQYYETVLIPLHFT